MENYLKEYYDKNIKNQKYESRYMGKRLSEYTKEELIALVTIQNIEKNDLITDNYRRIQSILS